MKKNSWVTLLGLLFIFGALALFFIGNSISSIFNENTEKAVAKSSILHLELEGVILDGKKFLKQLLKYRGNERIKAIVVSVNSPGGVVGPSQEIYEEIRRTREEYRKPVVMHSAGLMASGAFYVAVAADKIIVAPGTLMGSIGVIMEFANLEKLYDWAKIKRYSLTTGKYKDSGAEYRPMRNDEKALFQDILSDTWEQFKEAVSQGRGLKKEYVNQYADGRVFTGKQGVKLGFADEIGTLEEAYDEAADLADLDDYEIYDVPKKKGVLDFLYKQDEDGATSEVIATKVVDKLTQRFLPVQLLHRPLYLMPGAME